MFIVKKKIGNKEYYYLRSSERKGGKVRAITVAYLGKSKSEAERKKKEIVKNYNFKKVLGVKEKEKSKKMTEEKKLEKKDKVREKKVEKSGGKMENRKLTIDELASFCKRKGFVYPSAEVYGGMAGFWDFGHLGVEVVRNIKESWWGFHVRKRDDIEGIDGSIITNPKVWKASGHVESFVDFIVKNKKSGEKFKVDAHEVENYEKEDGYVVEGEFNPMFVTKVGPGESGVDSYLRPETAQSIFVNFRNVFDNARGKLPFGIAQIGKAFRNEIAPREFLFRSREFEQMELEYFVKKGMKCNYIEEIKGIKIAIFSEKMQKSKKNAEEMEILDACKKGLIGDWQAYWLAQEFSWFISLGGRAENFRARQHTSEEKSHYAVDTWDLEYKFPMGWRELQGFADRGDYDLTQHQKYSKKSFEVFDEDSKERVIPRVACEPSLGVGRAFLVFMLDGYRYDGERDNVVLHLSPELAPYKAAVTPIMSKGKIAEIGYEIFRDLKEEFNVMFDKSGSIGRRYSRQDEIGTPYCITVDGDSEKKKDVTIRSRDTTEQIRVKVNNLRETLRNLVLGAVSFERAGKIVKTRVK